MQQPMLNCCHACTRVGHLGFSCSCSDIKIKQRVYYTSCMMIRRNHNVNNIEHVRTRYSRLDESGSTIFYFECHGNDMKVERYV